MSIFKRTREPGYASVEVRPKLFVKWKDAVKEMKERLIPFATDSEIAELGTILRDSSAALIFVPKHEYEQALRNPLVTVWVEQRCESARHLCCPRWLQGCCGGPRLTERPASPRDLLNPTGTLREEMTDYYIRRR